MTQESGPRCGPRGGPRGGCPYQVSPATCGQPASLQLPGRVELCPSKIHVQVLSTSTSARKLNWKEDHCRCNLLGRGLTGGGRAPNPSEWCPQRGNVDTDTHMRKMPWPPQLELCCHKSRHHQSQERDLEQTFLQHLQKELTSCSRPWSYETINF